MIGRHQPRYMHAIQESGMCGALTDDASACAGEGDVSDDWTEIKGRSVLEDGRGARVVEWVARLLAHT